LVQSKRRLVHILHLTGLIERRKDQSQTVDLIGSNPPQSPTSQQHQADGGFGDYQCGVRIQDGMFRFGRPRLYPIHCGLRPVPSACEVVLKVSYFPVSAASRVFASSAESSLWVSGLKVRAASNAWSSVF